MAEHQYRFLVKAAAYSAVAFALVQIVLKFFAWSETGASALLASATDSLLDLATSSVNLILLSIALLPADDNHKFGHGKAESLAALFQSAFIFGAAMLLVMQGVEQMINPKEIKQMELGVYVTIISLVLTIVLVILQRIVVHKTKSVAIEADSLHYQSDILLNLGVLVSLPATTYLFPQADGVFTVIVAVILISGAVKILKQSVDQLMDHELDDAETRLVENIVNAHNDVKGLHDLRTRQSGPVKFVQFHLELDDNLNLVEAHDIGEQIKHQIEEALSPCEVLVHLDPWCRVVHKH
ncbi:cation diffusion facilitator family transporter [Thalassotalea marina]|uniref:Cation-efflux pump FieF n=1 Tax=Thalassotalea marina TaxID=1673741 RepID=A0A919EJV0_9GAMM|nr:cation diffusion facilitator family transporter [Thalassotalea marina]GHF87271.1 cation-efflux pump FieF [Thalassotalea marina]